MNVRFSNKNVIAYIKLYNKGNYDNFDVTGGFPCRGRYYVNEFFFEWRYTCKPEVCCKSIYLKWGIKMVFFFQSYS